jgi:D-aspartate ligase
MGGVRPLQREGSHVVACVMGHLTLVRPLAHAGVPCVVVAPAHSAESHSRLCRGAIACDVQEIADSGEELLARLAAFAELQPRLPVLFYEDDEQLLFVSRNRERLAKHFRFVIPDADLVEDLVDKGRFNILAQRLGLPVPRTRHVRPEVEPPPPELDLRFPLVAKPLRRRRSWEEGGHAAKAVPIASESELRACGLAGPGSASICCSRR